MTDAVLVRDATETDLPAIRNIYNHAVEHTTAIWNETLVDLDNRIEWFKASQGEGISGHCRRRTARSQAMPLMANGGLDGYRHTVEHSVYVDKDRRGAGIGELLMRALIERAAAANIHVMIAGIEAANAASIKLHEKLGFRVAGTFSEVGTKFGRWLDLTCMELRLRSEPHHSHRRFGIGQDGDRQGDCHPVRR